MIKSLEKNNMKRKKTWKKIVAIFMAVTMLPFGSLENCFASVAYAAEVSAVTEVPAEVATYRKRSRVKNPRAWRTKARTT